jgi:hypothetical protein
LIGLDID